MRLRPFQVVLFATFVATFLRFFHLATLTPEAWFDEVWFALRARELIADPQFVVFYRTPWGGGNALMVYLTAAAQLLGFTGISSSRIASAALGVIAVPLAHACFDELLRGSAFQSGSGSLGEPRLRRWIAALAAFILSYLLYWVIVSRVGTEPSLAPAAALFCVWQFKRAKRTLNYTVNFLLAGVVAGVAQYNGPHARFILPLLGVIALHDLFLIPAPRRKQYFTGLSLTALTGFIIIAPLALFFIRDPEWLLARAQITASVSLSQPGLLLENLRFTAISFNFVGSFDPLTNYPGLPMFDLIQSIGFFVGHAWLIWNLRRSPAARELLAWEIIMILPSLLTGDAPNFQRMIGFAAPAAAVISIGWMLAVQWVTSLRLQRLARLPFHLGFWVSRAFCGLCLGFGVFISLLYQSSTLILRYPRLSILPVSYLAVPVDTARELIKRAEAGERVFVSRNPEDDVISFEFLFPGTPVQRLDFRQCLPFADNRPARTNYLVLTKRDKQSVVNLYNAYPSAKIGNDYFWQDSGTLVEVPPGAPGPRPPNPGRATFDPGLTFVGYERSGKTIPAGQSLFITLYWKVEADIATDYTSFTHVGTGLNGTTVVAQRDDQPCQGLFTTSQWRAGDLIRDSFAITLPPDVPPGDYPLAIGWYTYPDFQRLLLLSAERALPDNRAIIATITVTR
jgi:hypothetical protein